jgi:hypothetical protein
MIFLSLSTAFAQELKHEAFCNSQNVKSMKGEKGLCSLVFTLNKATAQVASVKCTGIFMNVIPCTVTFKMGNYSTAQYACGTDPLKPTVKQVFVPEITSYSVAALITRENHEQDLVNDPTDYTNISGNTMKIDIENRVTDGVQKQSIAISLKMGEWGDWTDLSNVSCL